MLHVEDILLIHEAEGDSFCQVCTSFPLVLMGVKLFVLKKRIYVEDGGEWCAEEGTWTLEEGNNMREKKNA